MNSLIVYRKKDHVVANAALKSLQNHGWYLSEELVPLILFSKTVPYSIKQETVSKMLKCKGQEQLPTNSHGSGFEKPTFKELPQETTTSLASFVGPDSWMFFQIGKMSTTFLSKPVSTWNSDPEYTLTVETVKNIRVVNDSAERGFKLTSDFIKSAKTESTFQKILQVVKNSRNCLPDQRKGKKQSKSWFLTL